jgi:hypothetical protein
MPMSPRLLRPRAAGGFDPRTVAGLEAWWDGADSASVTLDSGRVSVWADKSGKGRNLANSSSGTTQPSYITAAQNGRNLVRFAAASSQRLSVASSTGMFNFLHDGTLSYVALVLRVGTVADPNAFYGFIGNAAGNPNVQFTYDDRGSIPRNDRLGLGVTNAAGGNTAGTVTSAPFDNFLTANTTVLCEAYFDVNNATTGNRLTARRNGGSLVTGSSGSGTAATGNAGGDLFVGSSGSTSFFQGDMCEILFYSNQPTSGAQQSIRQYLAAKWGLTLA